MDRAWDAIASEATTFDKTDVSTWSRNQTNEYFDNGFQSTIVWGDHVTVIVAEDVHESRQGNGYKAYIKLGTPSAFYSHGQIHIARQLDRNGLVNSADRKAEAQGFRELLDKKWLSWCFDNWALDFNENWGKRFEQESLNVTPERREEAVGILSPFLQLGAGQILVGPPESGKSWIAMLMQQSLEMGVQKLWGLPGGKRRCIFVNLERAPKSVKARAWGVNEALGLAPSTPIRLMNHRHAGGITTLRERLTAAIKRERVEVVFIDSISRLSGGGSLNDNEVANGIIDHLNGMGVSWVGLAHTPKGDGSSSTVFGSQHFTAGADLIFNSKLIRRDNGIALGLRVTKASDQARTNAFVQCIRLEFADNRLHLAYNDSLTKYPEFADVADASGGRHITQEIQRYLMDEGSATVAQIVKECDIPRMTVYRRLDNDGFVKLPKKGREQLYALADVYH